MRNRRFLFSAMALITALAALTFWRSSLFPAVTPPPPKPKLVIVLVIDQFRNDYLDRFRPYFVEKGFNLLLSGARFTTCRFDYAVTATGPGHATLYTGAYSNLHGIIENAWFDRSLRRPVNCVEDTDTKIVDSDKGPTDRRGASPHYLMGTTLGDEMRLASGLQSKVIGISLKDRAAILPGGLMANAAYWYRASSGRFVSSTYYMQALPPWVVEFNAQAPKEYCGKTWQALPETPGAQGELFSEFKPEGNEPCPDRRFLGWLNSTPYMNELELKFALAAIRNEHLGQGPATDLLAISLSVNDYIGHEYGPYSPQVADLTLRTDRALADFFAGVDHTVGLGNVWMALSGDHGVAPTPQFVREHHLGFGRFSTGPLKHAVEDALAEQFGQQRFVESIGIPYIYLDQDALKSRQIPVARAQAIVAEAALRVPGVRAAFTGTELERGQSAQDPLLRKALNSFLPSRSGDVFLILEPFAVPSSSDTGTTHGSPWNYDAQVPLVFWGTAFAPGTYSDPVEPIDLAPTFAAALGLDQPSGAEGRPLSQTLQSR